MIICQNLTSKSLTNCSGGSGFFNCDLSVSRTDYKHWIDSDKDCQNTRPEVLIAESLEEVTLDKKGCEVIKGKWHDPYTDKYFTNPNDLDIDYFVPLGEVDRSGGHEWPKNKKMEYTKLKIY